MLFYNSPLHRSRVGNIMGFNENKKRRSTVRRNDHHVKLLYLTGVLGLRSHHIQTNYKLHNSSIAPSTVRRMIQQGLLYAVYRSCFIYVFHLVEAGPPCAALKFVSRAVCRDATHCTVVSPPAFAVVLVAVNCSAGERSLRPSPNNVSLDHIELPFLASRS